MKQQVIKEVWEYCRVKEIHDTKKYAFMIIHIGLANNTVCIKKRQEELNCIPLPPTRTEKNIVKAFMLFQKVFQQKMEKQRWITGHDLPIRMLRYRNGSSYALDWGKD